MVLSRQLAVGTLDSLLVSPSLDTENLVKVATRVDHPRDPPLRVPLAQQRDSWRGYKGPRGGCRGRVESHSAKRSGGEVGGWENEKQRCHHTTCHCPRCTAAPPVHAQRPNAFRASSHTRPRRKHTWRTELGRRSRPPRKARIAPIERPNAPKRSSNAQYSAWQCRIDFSWPTSDSKLLSTISHKKTRAFSPSVALVRHHTLP